MIDKCAFMDRECTDECMAFRKTYCQRMPGDIKEGLDFLASELSNAINELAKSNQHIAEMIDLGLVRK